MNELDAAGSGSRLNFGGLSSGLDTGAIIDALMQLERRPLLLLERRQSGLEQQQAAIRELNSRLLALRDAAAALDNRSSGLDGPSANEEFLAYLASSSDETVASASASSDAAPGSYDLRVTALAQHARRVSFGYGDPSDSVTNKNRSLTIDYGDGQQIDLSVAKNTTLSELRDQINTDAGNDGTIRADLLFDGTGHRLVIAGEEPGVAHDVIVSTNLKSPTGGSFLDLAAGQDASDAELVYLGVAITRGSNEIGDLIPGVSVRLTGVNDASDLNDVVSIQVARDDESIVEKVQAFVDAYNAVREFSLQQSAVDAESHRGGPLIGDSLVRNVERRVQSIVGGLHAFADNPLVSVSQLGLSFEVSGELSFDADKLAAALDEDARSVRELLSGDDVEDGVATALGRALEPILQSGDGTLPLREDAIDTQLQSLERQIERFEDRLVLREETLVRRFSSLETLIAALQSQSGFLTSFGG